MSTEHNEKSCLMAPEHGGKGFKIWKPAIYRIEVAGEVEGSWSDCLGGMCIATSKRSDQGRVTELVGRVMDQAELLGVLNSLYEMHLPILSVQILGEK